MAAAAAAGTARAASSRPAARRRAEPSTGSRTAPRSFSARAEIVRPRATISAHGSTYATCQRLYRPGYSIPELSTPPRRRSTCRVRPSSTTGSNGAATRLTRTPPAVTKQVSVAAASAEAGAAPPYAGSVGASCMGASHRRARPAAGLRTRKAAAGLPGGRHQDCLNANLAPPNGGATSLRPGSVARGEPSTAPQRASAATCPRSAQHGRPRPAPVRYCSPSWRAAASWAADPCGTRSGLAAGGDVICGARVTVSADRCCGIARPAMA